MAESEKLQKWQETWQSHWKKEGPPAYELTPAGEVASAEWEREFLATARTPEKEKQRLDRIMKEFSHGFDRLYRLGPAVTVFGSARFREGSAYYRAGVEVGRELARAGFAVITGGGPGMMEAANRGAKEAGGVSIGCNIVLPARAEAEPLRGRRGQLQLLLCPQGDAGEVLLRLRLPAGRFRDAGRNVRSRNAHPVS